MVTQCCDDNVVLTGPPFLTIEAWHVERCTIRSQSYTFLHKVNLFKVRFIVTTRIKLTTFSTMSSKPNEISDKLANQGAMNIFVSPDCFDISEDCMKNLKKVNLLYLLVQGT